MAVATGGWVDMLTLNPVDPAQIGQEASFSFVIDVGGTMSGQGTNHSYNSLVRFGLRPCKNDAFFAPGPESCCLVQGQGQQGFPCNHTVNQLVTLTTTVTLGTTLELGVFARAWAGNASWGSVQSFSGATADFSNTITWAGISALTLNGNAVPYTLASASGTDWTQPYVAAVPEPTTWPCGPAAWRAWRRRASASVFQPASASSSVSRQCSRTPKNCLSSCTCAQAASAGLGVVRLTARIILFLRVCSSVTNSNTWVS